MAEVAIHPGAAAAAAAADLEVLPFDRQLPLQVMKQSEYSRESGRKQATELPSDCPSDCLRKTAWVSSKIGPALS